MEDKEDSLAGFHEELEAVVLDLVVLAVKDFVDFLNPQQNFFGFLGDNVAGWSPVFNDPLVSGSLDFLLWAGGENDPLFFKLPLAEVNPFLAADFAEVLHFFLVFSFTHAIAHVKIKVQVLPLLREV